MISGSGSRVQAKTRDYGRHYVRGDQICVGDIIKLGWANQDLTISQLEVVDGQTCRIASFAETPVTTRIDNLEYVRLLGRGRETDG